MGYAIIIIFCLGYLLITLEHTIHVNKTASALVTGILCWTVYILYSDAHTVTEQLLEHLGEISSILFFLMGAMTIVELIDSHDGFEIINKTITTRNRRTLLWIICILTFFLSAVLDNLTTTIVMVTLSIKMIHNMHYRMLFIGMVIISANAGGAWSPIGDVTTTMLWIGGQISTTVILGKLIFPSLMSMIVPLVAVSLIVKGNINEVEIRVSKVQSDLANSTEQRVVLFSGLAVLLLVPVFKAVTHLPPFMGMLLGLGLLWFLTEILHKDKDEVKRKKLSVTSALERMDSSSVLFFLGILLAVGVLQQSGQLAQMATVLTNTFSKEKVIISLIGLLSAIVDNVPIVAATMGMYSLDQYPMDHSFWTFLAFCAGTGGSILIIGSAAGVAAMGLEKISFGWYLKNISW
ncbi:MAG: sodium:proton antiporter NhaD, partial [Saprospiraceae bacterium]